jgi:hypothetical protein
MSAWLKKVQRATVDAVHATVNRAADLLLEEPRRCVTIGYYLYHGINSSHQRSTIFYNSMSPLTIH